MKICWKTLLMYTVLSQQSLGSTRDIQLFLKTKKIQNQFCFKYASDNEKKSKLLKVYVQKKPLIKVISQIKLLKKIKENMFKLGVFPYGLRNNNINECITPILSKAFERCLYYTITILVTIKNTMMLQEKIQQHIIFFDSYE